MRNRPIHGISRHASCVLKLAVIVVAVVSGTVVTEAQSETPSIPTTELSTGSSVRIEGQSATLLPDGRWLSVGGINNGVVSDAIGGAEGTSDAAVALRLTVARADHSATVLPDGSVFVFGGVDVSGQLVNVAEIIDLSANSVRAMTVTSLVARAKHTATLLTDGRVLIAGGVDSHGVAIAAAQLWNPKTGTVDSWNPLMMKPRYDHSASLLANGEDLISGGRTNAASSTPLNELYNPTTNVFEPTDAFSDSRTLLAIKSAQSGIFIAQSLPAPESVDVPTDTRIALRFSEAVNMPDVNASTITVIGPNGAVSGKAVGAEAGMLAFFTPSVELAPGTTYTAFIRGIRDALGNVVSPATIRFTTHRYETLTNNQMTPGVAPVVPANTATTTPAVPTTPSVTKATPAPKKVTALIQKPDVMQNVPQDTAEDWIPQDRNRHGQWRVLGLPGDPPLSAAASTPLVAPAAAAGVVGRVLRLNGKPLAGVLISIGGTSSTTDANGQFSLTSVAAGSQQLLVDGTAVVSNGRHYTKHYIHVDVSATTTTVLSNPIYLLRVDPASEISISSPASQEIVLTHPAIPGLEVHIPQGTVLREANGKIVTKVSITPVPVDRAPYPTPGNFSAYFTLQPGGAFVDGDSTKAIRVIYPNYLGLAPGTRVNFFNYDPSGKGWGVYGQGTVTKDGKQITPDNGAGFHQIMGFGLAVGGTASPPGPKAGGPCCGDPVDLYTGFFTNTETDMTISDVIPISVTRTYMSNDTVVHAFGVGTNLSYDMHLYTPDSNSDIYLVQPDGSQIHYTLQSTSPYIWKNLDSPTAYYGSVMQYIPGINGQINLTQDRITVTLVNQTVLTFASDGNLNQLLSIADPNGNSVQLTRSSGRSGNITQIASPNGRYIQLTYDPICNRVTQVTDNLQRTVNYTYVAPTTTCTLGLYQVQDQNRNTETYAYDSSNRLQSLTDKNKNQVFLNVYNASNQVTKQTLADGTFWQFSYPLLNNVLTVTDPRGYQQQVTFNANGFPTQSILAVGQPEQQAYAIARYSSNLVQSVTDQLSRVTYYNWDAYGKLTSLMKLYGTANAVTYGFGYDPIFHQLVTYTDPLNHTTQFAYDAYGKLNTVTNALSNSWTILNNAAGLPTKITDPLSNASQIGYEQADDASVQDPLGRTSHLFTDEIGRVISATDPIGNTFQYGYDPRDQLLTVTDPNHGLTSIAYDANGNVTSVTDPRTLASHGYTPDSRNRVHIYKDPLGATATYTYDGNDNLTSKLDRKGQLTKYQYDGINRLHIVTYPDNSTLTITWDGGNRPTSFADTANGTIGRGYDGLDRLTQETGPQGTINYLYDAAGRRSQVTIAGQTNPIIYGFDNANRLTSLTQGTVAVGWGYDTANRLTSVTLPNGIASAIVPDAAGEISSITYNKGATQVANVVYTYDADGHRITANGTLVRPVLDGGLTGTTYDNGNHLSAVTAGAFTYDSNGNLSTQGNATPASYTWNVRDQLTGTSNGTTLAYDALGRLVSRTQSGATTTFLYDGANQVEVNGNLMLRGANLDEVETQVTSTGTINYLTDGLGSASTLTDSTGNVTTLYSYGAYGATASTGVSGQATVDTPFKYTGADYNAVDDLYYFRNRYYSPHLQRFISEDPIGLGGGINLNAYTAGNPISWRDPAGEDPILAVIGVIAGTGYGIVNGIIAGDSRNELVTDAIAGAAQGGLIGLTDGLSLVQGAIVAGGIESYRQIANSAITGCNRFDKGGVAFAIGGSVFGDLVGGASNLIRAERATAANHFAFLPEQFDNLARFISLNVGGVATIPYSAVTGLSH